MFYEQFIKLCDIKGVTPTKVVTSFGMSRGNLSNWKKGGVPSIDVLKKFAGYFDVSTDYLLGNENKKSPAVDGEDEVPDDFVILARKVQDIPEDMRKEIYNTLNSTVDTFLEAIKRGRKDKK